ncbi:MAG: exodeoxyribonuclease VII small subunit [Dehalococcoidia bacterium]|jgi:exodeoxyribonuclease VII small subunit|nr:exodeoxyribonuclease VII small subunit [Dehalococcoidia bacterium]
MTNSDAGASSDGALDDLSFEQLYGQLEDVTARLEGGDLSLEQSVALFEQGMKLAQRCQQLLGDVEQRVETLRQAFEGDPPA